VFADAAYPYPIRQKAVDMWLDGFSIPFIISMFGLSAATVCRWRTGDVKNDLSLHIGKTILYEADDEIIMRYIIDHPGFPSQRRRGASCMHAADEAHACRRGARAAVTCMYSYSS
jgi:hypothetical protein